MLYLGAEGVDFRVGDDNFLQKLNPSDVINKQYTVSSHSGWISSYLLPDESNNLIPDGRAIVFDDSFEHEVIHTGKRDRYVVLIVLKHPDVVY